MTITISHWIFPILITIAIWGAAELKVRFKPDQTGFGIGAIVDAYVYGAFAIGGTLVTWMGYFAWLAWHLS